MCRRHGDGDGQEREAGPQEGHACCHREAAETMAPKGWCLHVLRGSIRVTDCFHANGQNAACQTSGILSLIIFGGIQVLLSQLPSLGNVSMLSYIAAAMSLAYSFVGLYLCIVVLVSHREIRGSAFATEVAGNSLTASSSRIWRTFQALGNVAFAYTFSMLSSVTACGLHRRFGPCFLLSCWSSSALRLSLPSPASRGGGRRRRIPWENRSSPPENLHANRDWVCMLYSPGWATYVGCILRILA